MANILRFGVEANLRNRLCLMAEQELVSLFAILQDFVPSEGEDQWFLRHGICFSTKHAYGVLITRPDADLMAPLIWSAKVPRKLKVFAWLLFKDRLNTRVNLACKHIIDLDIRHRCATTT